MKRSLFLAAICLTLLPAHAKKPEKQYKDGVITAVYGPTQNYPVYCSDAGSCVGDPDFIPSSTYILTDDKGQTFVLDLALGTRFADLPFKPSPHNDPMSSRGSMQAEVKYRLGRKLGNCQVFLTVGGTEKHYRLNNPPETCQ